LYCCNPERWLSLRKHIVEEFYKKLGFELLYGGEGTAFSSLKAGEAFVNLAANPGYVPNVDITQKMG
jgi:hypothetical protein